jgi:hypothetical protein
MSIVSKHTRHAQSRDTMLRSLIRSMLLLAVSVGAVQAQKKKEKDVKPGAVELIRLENAWADGLVKRDGALFDRLLATKFVYTENDKLMRRDEVLHDVVAGPDTVKAAHNEGMEVQQFGAVTAVVTGWLIVEGRSNGTAFTHRYRFTDTWVKRQSRWQIAAAQDYLAPK